MDQVNSNTVPSSTFQESWSVITDALKAAKADPQSDDYKPLQTIGYMQVLPRSTHPCPSCGHCPTCGRRGWSYPHTFPYVSPYPTWPTTTITCNYGSGGNVAQ